jgi:TolA-binding protein
MEQETGGSTATRDHSEETEETQVPSHVDEILADTRRKMEEELEELRPQHEAFVRLEQIVNNFDAVASGRAITTKRTGNGSRAPRGSRSNEFVALVRESGEDGTTVAEAAEKMEGINPNYLYRLAKDLVESDDPQIRKDGKRYFAVETAE